MLTQVIDKALCPRCQHSTMVKIHGEVECLACGYEMVSSSPIDAGTWVWDKVKKAEAGLDQDSAIWTDHPSINGSRLK